MRFVRKSVWARLLLVGLLGSAVAAWASGDATPASVGVGPGWPTVHLNVIALGKNGAAQKLGDDDFVLEEDGAKPALHVVAGPDSPVSLAVLVDTSESVYGSRVGITAAVKSIVKGLPAGSEVALIDFNSVAYVDVPFTPVAGADLSSLDKLQASGPTALYDALMATEDYVVKKAKYPRRAIVIVSAGQENASKASERNAFWKEEQPNAPTVYVCITTRNQIFDHAVNLGHIYLNFVAKRGGGLAVKLNPDAEAAGSMIADAIRSQYVLQFTDHDPARDGKARKISVRVNAKDVEVHTLFDYFAPAK